ncbi:aldo/keto reductase family protein [Geomicrobium sp. JSM 1781026]|uniref:aldo/keto reductase family protein n=1 Tax=Geomicrobium sp. JSM 1781026 TaxID=3344580 RepID=UPI0035BF2243
MQYRHLGSTGVRVSEISLGSWLTYAGYVDDRAAEQTIHTAYDLGINFFDTANVYMKGEAEKLVGNALKSYDRSSYVLATKVYGEMGQGVNDRGLSRKHIIEQCEASLKRLDHDYVDLYYCHRFDSSTPVEESIRALDDLVRQGKVLYIGVSQWTPAQMSEALHIADRKLLDRFVVNQPLYNMLDRSIEDEVIPLGKQHGFGQVVYSPLAQGVLSGKYKRGSDIPKGSRAEENFTSIQRFMADEQLDTVQELQTIARELDLTLSQLALSWILRKDNVSSAIIGASRPDQVEENVRASGVVLEQNTLEKIDALLG